MIWLTMKKPSVHRSASHQPGAGRGAAGAVTAGISAGGKIGGGSSVVGIESTTGAEAIFRLSRTDELKVASSVSS
jgi:hypothetical protein